mmetsp:Transcript_8529/g.15768  ORF Transcript_8529/g.15768 Transcript_8529/m.15768 type:complete len:271 (-) Transcript_8529:97-909(-)
MVSQAPYWSLSLDAVLQPESEEGKHGQSSVLNLLELKLLEALSSLSRCPAKRIEYSPRVARLVSIWQFVLFEYWVLVDATLLLHVLVPSDLNPVHEVKLNDKVGLRVSVVRESRGIDPVDSSTWPVETQVRKSLWHENSEAAKHRKTGVQKFRLSKPFQLVFLCSELERVKAIVTRERSVGVKIFWCLLSWIPRRRFCSLAHDKLATWHNSRRPLQGSRDCCVHASCYFRHRHHPLSGLMCSLNGRWFQNTLVFKTLLVEVLVRRRSSAN